MLDSVVVIETADNFQWNSRMKYYWPRIFKYLDSSSVTYNLSTFAVLPAPYGRTSLRSEMAVDIEFHPHLLEEPLYLSLLIGTLAHEGLHAMLYAIRGELNLPFAQQRRLIESHWISDIPYPGYGQWLVDIKGRSEEPAIELLTNKLLKQHGLKLLLRDQSGDYADAQD